MNAINWKECKPRHDGVGKRIHREVYKKYWFQVKEKWYEHEPHAVTETDCCNILWDFSVQTDHVIEARYPDKIIANKECISHFVDFAIPYNRRVGLKENEIIKIWPGS